MGKDYYRILQLNRIDKDKDIKTASVSRCQFSIEFPLFSFSLSFSSYRRLALQYHPSKNRDDFRAARQFHDIAEAYDVLSSRMYSERWLLLVSSNIWISIRFKIRNERSTISMVNKA
jgi:hypothetical protein